MDAVRPLLAVGNGKLGQCIAHFDLPAAGAYCPGSTELCRSVCYALRSRYLFPQVREALQWRYRQSLRPDFARRAAAEINRRGLLVVRLHCSGDFYSPHYARAWLEVMRQCGRAVFFLYSRSWRVGPIREVLEQMARLDNAFVWYSLDEQTGRPQLVPPRVRLAWLMTDVCEPPRPPYDLVFTERSIRAQVSLPLVCDQETGAHENCGSCQRCFT